MEGRVEILYNGVWGTVCDDAWDIHDATVVCRMLGYGRALWEPRNAFFGEGSGDILLYDVRCSGTEDNLADCLYGCFNKTRNCFHNNDAGIICGHINSPGKYIFWIEKENI